MFRDGMEAGDDATDRQKSTMPMRADKVAIWDKPGDIGHESNTWRNLKDGWREEIGKHAGDQIV